MDNKKVLVLLSSYNGEKCIKEQLDSIMDQSMPVSLLIRDDGSTDDTMDILIDYAEKHGGTVWNTEQEYIEATQDKNTGMFDVVKGENKGFIKSFHWLIANSTDADYYAFSDQDDVWFMDKISMAVSMLVENSETNSDKPALYFSNYDLYDDKDGSMTFMGHAFQEDYKRQPSFHNAIVDCMPLGFNSVFNYTAKKIMTEYIPKCSCGHDWWTYMVCAGMGKVIYDSRPTVKYRRTGSNVSAGGMSFLKFQIWRIKKFIFGGYFNNVKRMQAEFYHVYKDKLSKKDEKQLSLFARKGYNPIVAVKKMCYPKRYRESLVDELMLRFFFLIGRL